jgi:hypothetical protein
MNNHTIIFSLIALLLSMFLIFGCNDELTEEEEKARLDNMEQEILSMISDLSCADSTECSYIGFGSKPCGGFWRYLIYSRSNVDTVLLKDKVRKYNEYNKSLNIKYGWISDCSLPPIPNVKCILGECTGIIER